MQKELEMSKQPESCVDIPHYLGHTIFEELELKTFPLAGIIFMNNNDNPNDNPKPPLPSTKDEDLISTFRRTVEEITKKTIKETEKETNTSSGNTSK